VRLHTNVDTSVVVSADHPLKLIEDPATGEPRPYVALGGGLEAKLTRPVYYDLVDLGVEEKRGGDQMFGIWSAGTFHVLGPAET
jgi:uncharacterized protein